MKRPFCNLFVFQTLDGKIKLPESGFLPGLGDYRSAYSDTYFWHLVSGRALADVSVAKFENFAHDKSCGLVIVDTPALSQDVIDYVSERYSDVIIITYGNRKRRASNVDILKVTDIYNVTGWMETLYKCHGIKMLTVHGGGEMNASLLRAGLIDTVDVFISPVILGGNTIPTLAGGDSLRNVKGLAHLQLMATTTHASGCVHLKYTVSDVLPLTS